MSVSIEDLRKDFETLRLIRHEISCWCRREYSNDAWPSKRNVHLAELHDQYRIVLERIRESWVI